VGGVGQIRQAISADTHGHHHVEPEKREVGEVIIVKRLAIEMSVYKPEAAEPVTGAGIILFEVGQEDRFCVADYDVCDASLAVHEDSYLSSDFARYLGEVSRDLVRDDLVVGYLAPVEALQVLDLIDLQAQSLAVYPVYSDSLQNMRLRFIGASALRG
jgi:hypothetical protein